jgi:hypothetical protein
MPVMRWQYVIALTCLVVGLVFWVGCSSRPLAVWVQPGSTSAQLTFGVGERHYDTQKMSVLTVTVLRRGEHKEGSVSWDTVWNAIDTTRMALGRGVPAPIKYLVYGRPVPGLVSKYIAAPLVPDEYDITVDMNGGLAGARFMVHPDGSVVQIRDW